MSSNGNVANGQVKISTFSQLLFVSKPIYSEYYTTMVCTQSNEKSLQRWLDNELEVMVNVHEVRYEYEKQSQVYVN